MVSFLNLKCDHFRQVFDGGGPRRCFTKTVLAHPHRCAVRDAGFPHGAKIQAPHQVRGDRERMAANEPNLSKAACQHPPSISANSRLCWFSQINERHEYFDVGIETIHAHNIPRRPHLPLHDPRSTDRVDPVHGALCGGVGGLINSAVVASEARQSRGCGRQSGLLRFARNDGVG